MSCKVILSEQRMSKAGSTLLNGELLRVAEVAGFEVLLTTDASLPHQQNLKGPEVGGSGPWQEPWILIEPRMKEIAAAVNSAKPGTYSLVEISDR